MKRIIFLLPLLLLLTEGTALAKPDYSELNQAFTNFFAALDAIAEALPSVNNASGTVQVIDAWSRANETLCAVMERFAAKHPEVYGEREPPPELTAVFAKMDRLKTHYTAVSENVGKLARRFSAAPEVQEAIKRFRASIDRVANLVRRPKPQKNSDP